MKKLPKRDGYKPKPLPRMPTVEEILKRQMASEISRLAEENGIDVREFLRRRGERKGDFILPSGERLTTLGISLLKIEAI